MWRAASDADGGEAPVFPRDDGAAWTIDSYKNWHRRRFKPAAAAIGITARPYDLRHSFASLMIQAGYTAVELAAELGHAPTQTLDTYAHVFSEFRRGERIDPNTRSESTAARTTPTLRTWTEDANDR